MTGRFTDEAHEACLLLRAAARMLRAGELAEGVALSRRGVAAVELAMEVNARRLLAMAEHVAPAGNGGFRPAPPRALLLCTSCGRSDACDPAELPRYAREGWPHCCGGAMGFLTDAGEPARPHGP
jgi:hypothetical protein